MIRVGMAGPSEVERPAQRGVPSERWGFSILAVDIRYTYLWSTIAAFAVQLSQRSGTAQDQSSQRMEVNVKGLGESAAWLLLSARPARGLLRVVDLAVLGLAMRDRAPDFTCLDALRPATPAPRRSADSCHRAIEVV